MSNRITASNWMSPAGNPTGGTVRSNGLFISWQDGPLGRHHNCEEGKPCVPGCTRRPSNGAFVEDVIEAVIQRLEFFQTAAQGKFECHQNTMALNDLKSALGWLKERTAERQERGVEGTHAV